MQHQLFDLGGELCISGMALIQDGGIDALERDLDAFNEPLPPLRTHPAGRRRCGGALSCRTRPRSRRAERDVIALSRVEPVRAQAIRYLNRLSDLLFVIARVLARNSGAGEVIWERNKRG